jgi:regulator of RNase E activity RraA
MIPNNRIISTFPRPDRTLVARFAGLPVSNIGDVMNRLACFAPRIRPVNNAPLLGTALTVKTRPGDILFIHKALDLAKPGDVLVIDGRGDLTIAIVGGLMTAYARKKGLAGMIIDGSVRDVDAMRKLTDFSIYASGVSPNGPTKIGGGEIGTAISCGDIMVNPGDIIVGDPDGVVAVNPAFAESVIEQTKAYLAREQGIYERIQKDGTWDRAWVDEALKAIGCHEE